MVQRTFNIEDPETSGTNIESLVVMLPWICAPLFWLQKFGHSFTGLVSLESSVDVFIKKQFRKELEKLMFCRFQVVHICSRVWESSVILHKISMALPCR